MNVPVPVKLNSVSQPTGARCRFFTASSYCEPLAIQSATPVPIPATSRINPMMSSGVRRPPLRGGGSTVASISAHLEPVDDEIDAVVGLNHGNPDVVGPTGPIEV